MAYPTASDVTDFLSSIAITPGESYDFDGDLAASIKDFERATGRPSFQSDGVATSVRYDPPDRLDGRSVIRIHDFYEITTVVYGYSTTDAGTELTEEDDYLLLRDEEDGPVVGIQFLVSVGIAPRSIRVTGKRGYSASCPGDVSKAIVRHSAARYLRSPDGQAGVERRRKIGDREIEWDTTAGCDTISRFDNEFADVCASYRRLW